MPALNPTLRSRGVPRVLLVCWLLTGLLGLALVAARLLSTGAYDWKPVQVPLPLEAGGRADGSFVAEVDGAYEIALEFDAVLPETEMRALLGEPGATALTWTVSSDGEAVAQGNSEVLLYHSRGGRTFAGRMRRWLLGIPFHRDQGSLVQVVGRIRAATGQRYEISVEQGRLDPALQGSSPRLGAQLSREFWARHTKGTLTLGHYGLGLIGASGLLFVAWLAAAWRRGRASGADAG